MEIRHLVPFPEKFYTRSPDIVASQLIGALLIFGPTVVRIVETEAYFGPEDPASRAAINGQRGRFSLMWERPGLSLVYNVHRYWMFNVVAHEEGEVGAILIRAAEPIIPSVIDLRGPGKLTRALGIDASHHGKDLTIKGDLYLSPPQTKVETVGCSYRIGVTKDLMKPYRFFDPNSNYVSAHKKAVYYIKT
ncbi:MAG: DNA-3-methyladenine glycosylase [Candidatus Korarchaeota archaeon]